MNNISIAIIGNDNIGKTTLTSILCDLKIPDIRRKKSTLKPNIIKYTSISREPEDLKDKKIFYTQNKILNLEFDVSIIDTSAFTTMTEYNSDIVISMFDINDGFDINKINTINPLTIYVVNKYDHLKEDEELLRYLDETKTALKTDIIKLDSKYIYDYKFNNHNEMQSVMNLMFNNYDNICDKFGLTELKLKLCNFINDNIDAIFNNRINRLNKSVNNKISIKDLVSLYDECSIYKKLDKSLNEYIEELINNEKSIVDANISDNNDSLSDSESSVEETDEEQSNKSNQETIEFVVDDEIMKETQYSFGIFNNIHVVIDRFDDNMKEQIVDSYYNIYKNYDVSTFKNLFGLDDSICNYKFILLILNYYINRLSENTRSIIIIDKDHLYSLLTNTNIDAEKMNNIKELFVKYVFKFAIRLFILLEQYKFIKNKKYTDRYINILSCWIDINKLIKKYNIDLNISHLIFTNKSVVKLINKNILSNSLCDKSFLQGLDFIAKYIYRI